MNQTDIVERLRECLADEWCCLEVETANRISEAADEIERLRKECDEYYRRMLTARMDILAGLVTEVCGNKDSPV